jgi:hypothetical protein
MKALSTSVVVILATSAAIAQGQTYRPKSGSLAGRPSVQCPAPIPTYPGPYYVCPRPYYVPYYWPYVTPAESLARARATLMHALAHSTLLCSVARNNFAEARRREIENEQKWVETCFRKQEINEESRRAECDRRNARRARLQQAILNKPERTEAGLLGIPAGKVRWPSVLQTEELTACRRAVEGFLLRQAAVGRGLPREPEKVAEAAEVLLTELRNGVRKTSGNDYVAAKRFLERVASELRNQAG